MSALLPFWASFWSADPTKWEYRGPWWVTQTRETDLGVTLYAICCAVMAADETEAWAIIHAAHDLGHVPIDWRFMTDNDPGWAPFSARFVRAPWMQWPYGAREMQSALDEHAHRGRPASPEELAEA